MTTTPLTPITPTPAANPQGLPRPVLNGDVRRFKPGPRRAWIWKSLLVSFALAALSWGGYRWYAPSGAETAEITGTAVRGTLQIMVNEKGDLESAKSIDVRCEVEGYQNKIVSILPEGVSVKKDQEVLRFDADQIQRSFSDQEVKWKQAEGKAKAARGELEMQKNKAATDIDKAVLALTLAELDLKKYVEGDYIVALEKLKGEIELARKDLQEADEKLEHFRKFVKQGFGVPEQLRAKELDVATKRYQLRSKEAELKVLTDYTKQRQEAELSAKARDAKRELERAKATGQAAIDKAQSDLDASVVSSRLEKSALDRLKRQLDNCIVKAPQDGILVYSKDRYYDPSSRVQAGAMVHFRQTLFSLPDLSQMQVKVKVHEAMVKKTKPGQKAEIRVDAYANIVLHGTVKNVATLANSEGYWDERSVKEYVTIVSVDDLPSEAGLKPGMSCQVKILVNELPDVLVVPVQAVSQLEGKHYSFIFGPAGVERREVMAGENNDKFVEIKSGLSEGDRVALDARARTAAEAKAKEEKEGIGPTKAKTEPKAEPKSAPPRPAPPPGK